MEKSIINHLIAYYLLKGLSGRNQVATDWTIDYTKSSVERQVNLMLEEDWVKMFKLTIMKKAEKTNNLCSVKSNVKLRRFAGQWETK